MLDLGVLKVLLQVGLMPAVGGWERGCWDKIPSLEFGCGGQERSWIFLYVTLCGWFIWGTGSQVGMCGWNGNIGQHFPVNGNDVRLPPLVFCPRELVESHVGARGRSQCCHRVPQSEEGELVPPPHGRATAGGAEPAPRGKELHISHCATG